MQVSKEVYSLISSYKTSLVLLMVYAAGLAAATFIEKFFGSAAAKSVVYYAPYFIFLQMLLVANFIAACFRYGLFASKRLGLLVTHVGFIVVLLGAFVSYIFGEDGYIHLREGEKSNKIMVYSSDGQMVEHRLPFEVYLEDFILTRYPGSSSPSSYESDLIIYVDGQELKEKVYMNNVVDVKGYRFFQASFDKDEKGSILSVNRDVYGKNITYAGYLTLALGFLLCFFAPHSRFRMLGRKLKELQKTAIFLFVFLLPGVPVIKAEGGSLQMETTVKRLSVDERHASFFGRLSVQSDNGRMLPVNTFSSEILRKLHKEDKFGGLNSDQFLLSVLAMPQMWMRVPLIALSNEELAETYGLTNGYCAFSEVFNNKGEYKLQSRLDEVYAKSPASRTSMEKDLLKLDEQVNIFYQIINYQMLNIFPLKGSPSHKWYAAGDDLSQFRGKDSLFVSNIMKWYLSEVQVALQSNDWSKADEVLHMIHVYQEKIGKELVIPDAKVNAEIKYNKLEIFRWCKIGYLVLGGLLLCCSFLMSFRRKKFLDVTSTLLSIGIALVFVWQMYGFGLRWYISGYAPWSNSYETMVYVAWATVLAGLIFSRNRMAFALATIFGGIILFVSGLSWMDPQINPLVPVLKSPWLMFHVAVIVAAYGFFGISSLIGLTNLVLMLFLRKGDGQLMVENRIKELSIINEMALWIGLALMTAGTFLGAVWANVSWGRYWGWDPKETWALITMIVYAIVLHLHLVKRWINLWSFNFLSVVAFLSVLMTFFGVNYFLSGMHSYGQNDNINHLFVYIMTGIVLIIALGIAARRQFAAFMGTRKSEEIE